MKFHVFVALVVVLVFVSFAAAQTLQGTVTNGTTGKPAAGAEVTLLSLANGMSEAGHTKTDAAGKFTLSVPPDGGMPHLVRVSHQNVNYFKMAPPGTGSVEVEVYDASAKVDAITSAVQIMRLQSDGATLQVSELYAVRNASQPPRTLLSNSTFSIALPAGSQIDEAAAASPNGQPISTMPSPVAGKAGQYSFDFPLRPGETQFQIAYHLPYNGKATIKPILLRDVQHFVAFLPKTMQFQAVGSASFVPMPEEGGNTVEVVTNAKAGENVAFAVSGTGILADDNAPDSQPQQAGGSSSGNITGSGPGGGLGRPIDTPDPLSRYRWPLLGAFAAVMVAGGFYVVNRHAPGAGENGVISVAPSAAAGSKASVPVADTTPAPGAAKDASHSAMMLETMKEELFQLELDRQQGRISEAEYEKAKAALDLTIKRSLTRGTTSS